MRLQDYHWLLSLQEDVCFETSLTREGFKGQEAKFSVSMLLQVGDKNVLAVNIYARHVKLRYTVNQVLLEVYMGQEKLILYKTVLSNKSGP